MKRKLILVTLLVFFGLSNNMNAQWQRINGLYGGHIKCFATDGTNLFAGTYGGGVYLSINNGNSWNPVNNGILSDITYTSVGSIIIVGANMYAGTNHGIYQSSNNGGTWTLLGNSYFGSSDGSYLAISGATIFAGSWGSGVWRSIDDGSNWSQVNTGLSNQLVRSLVISGTNIFAGTQGSGVFLSTNNGDSWTQVNTGLTNLNVYSLVISGTNIFAGTYGGGVFLSTNNGSTWTAVNNGLTNYNVQALAINGTTDLLPFNWPSLKGGGHISLPYKYKIINLFSRFTVTKRKGTNSGLQK
jgi:hypothetical protein